MFQSDLAGILIVYIYVAILLIITEKINKKYPVGSRKILHIMVGNIAFFLPIFETKEAMAFLAAGPFIILTFLMSPHTPIKKLKNKTSAAGHSMGLVYYSITWTILAYFMFEQKYLISLAIIAMSYGDGFASLIGQRYSKKKIIMYGDVKSPLGSFSMFIFTAIMSFVILIYYDIGISSYIIGLVLIVSVSATFAELITPKGLDNLSVPFISVFYYWMGMIM
jgi:dolichol kinase